MFFDRRVDLIAERDLIGMAEQFAVHSRIAALLAFGATTFGFTDSPIGAVYDLHVIGAALQNSYDSFIPAHSVPTEPPHKCFSGIFFRARPGRVFGLAMLMELSR